MEDDEEDVVQEGSPLHEHLVREGFLGATSKAAAETADARDLFPRRRQASGVVGKWPSDASLARLELEVVRRVLASDLMVQEDEDFVSNFLLTDDNTAASRESRQDSALGDALLFSGSLAAAAAAVLYLSERTRLAATVAAVLPAAMAAFASVGQWRSRPRDSLDKEQFESLVDQLLADMKLFKQLMRKSLNLIQGMELMHSGFTLAVNSDTGAASTSSSSSASESPMSRALSDRECFPALRQAAYQAAVQLIRAYRDAVELLMKVSPLADHVDLKEHYIAFVELATFGIENEKPSIPPSVKDLRDVVQLGLIQQSEYLRRFALSFSEKVREDHELDKAGLLKHIRDLVSTLQKINSRLSKVFEYHQAMGVLPERKQKALVQKRKENIDLIPLRSVYTSLFSTGLHLQNSLLRVRQLEKAFDVLEKVRAKDAIGPTEERLVEWLRGFEAIQSELNACVGCLDEGMAQIDFLQVKDVKESRKKTTKKVVVQKEATEDAKPALVRIDDSTLVEHLDEVFEAVMDRELLRREDSALDAEPITEEERRRRLAEKKQSERLLRELRSVLVERAVERERRETAALARMEGREDVEARNVAAGTPPRNEVIGVESGLFRNDDTFAKNQNEEADAFLMNNNHVDKENGASGFDDSFSQVLNAIPLSELTENGRTSSPSTSCSSSSSSDQATVKSAKNPVPNGPNVPKSFSGQLLDNDDDDNDDASSDNSSSYEDHDGQADTEDSDVEVGQGDRLLTLQPAPSVESLPLATQQHDAKTKDRYCSLSELRSISSPDLKHLLRESSSPYVSLERLGVSSHGDLPDSDGNGSADEMQHQVLKTYRRPLRPAALRQQGGAGTAVNHRRKRDRNRTVTLRNGDVPRSSYVEKNDREDNQLFFPARPIGFDASIAMQAARKAMNGKMPWQKKQEEEVFGSESSD